MVFIRTSGDVVCYEVDISEEVEYVTPELLIVLWLLTQAVLVYAFDLVPVLDVNGMP